MLHYYLYCLTFFSLSAIIHTWDFLKYNNPSIKNALRGVLMLGLLVWLIPVIYQALQLSIYQFFVSYINYKN